MPSSFQLILDRVRERQGQLACAAKPIWFRGHTSASWKLNSTLHRYIEQVRKYDFEPDFALLRAEEKSIYHGFQQQAWPLLNPSQRTDWGLLFTMQHFGVPTRLLDWTESFGCALFFAQERSPNQEAAIYMLSPEDLNFATREVQGIVVLSEYCRPGELVDMSVYHPISIRTDPVPPVAVMPVLTNPRMVAQQSVFLICGDSLKPLEDQLGGRLVSEGMLEKLILPADSYREANDFLSLAGIKDFGLFPDLEGFVRQFKKDRQRLFDLTNRMIAEVGMKPPE